MKIRVYQEHQGQGSTHADKDGLCWCAQNPETKAVAYLKATTKEDAVKEAAIKFAVQETDIETL